MSSAAAEVSFSAGPQGAQGTQGTEGSGTVQQPASDMATKRRFQARLSLSTGSPLPLLLVVKDSFDTLLFAFSLFLKP